jgi:uncharacterized protein
MSSKVWFTNVETKHGVSLEDKFRMLLTKAGLKHVIKSDDLTALKVHVGERGNLGYINHNYARIAAAEVESFGGKPFLTDTNTLYSGGRHNGVDHYQTANQHGFSLAATGAPFIVADGLRGTDYEEVETKGKHFRKVKMASAIYRADKFVALSHFKGHCEAGFAGSIKNLGMGCAPAAGKMDQHSSAKPQTNKTNCTGCRHCFRVCPTRAITMVDTKANIDYEKCIGCGQCVASCNFDAMHVDWNAHGVDFTERVCEYAVAVYERFKGKALYVNLAVNITPDCDCWGYNEPPLVADVGFLASENPAALDSATLDLVNFAAKNQQSRFHEQIKDKEDIFMAMREGTKNSQWFDYCRELGIESEYQLITI